MRASVLAVLILAATTSALGCAAAQVDYTPRTADVRPARDPSDVEVYTDDKPDWDYEVVGSFQEQSADSVPGGRPGLAALLREMGAERGCDAVIVGGRVSRFYGEYEHRDAPIHWLHRRSDARRSEAEWVPVFAYFGTNASCAVRVDRTPAALSRMESSGAPLLSWTTRTRFETLPR